MTKENIFLQEKALRILFTDKVSVALASYTPSFPQQCYRVKYVSQHIKILQAPLLSMIKYTKKMVIQTPSHQLSDLRAHKQEAIETLVHTYTEPLMAAALGAGFSRADAEELVQDTFVAFLSAIQRFEGHSQLKTFLFGILYNKGSELRRRNRRESATDQIETIFNQRFDEQGLWRNPPNGPEALYEAQELGEWIATCAEQLPLNQRMAFHLKEVEGEKTKDICKILKVSVTHLGVLLFRARNSLRECLEKKMHP